MTLSGHSESLPCFCCGLRATVWHHCLTRQELRRLGPPELQDDTRNLVAVCDHCHAAHHRFQPAFLLADIPDSVFEFACEVMGPGRAYEYLKRHYSGPDPRLDALLDEYVRSAA